MNSVQKLNYDQMCLVHIILVAISDLSPLSFPSDSGREVSWLCEADKVLSDLISPMEDGSVVSLLWERSSSSRCSSCPRLSGRSERALWSSLSCLRFVRTVTAGWRDGRLL